MVDCKYAVSFFRVTMRVAWLAKWGTGARASVFLLSLKALAKEDTLLRTHCCGHIVADTNVSPFARPRNICCGHKFCGRDTKIVSDFVQKHFVSAANVSQFAQPKKHHGQQCVLVYQGLNSPSLMLYREYSLFMYSFNSTWPKILKISIREPMVRNFPGKDSTGKSGTIQPKILEIWGNSNGTDWVIPGKKFPNILVYPQGRPLSRKIGKKLFITEWKVYYVRKPRCNTDILNNPLFCVHAQSFGWIP